MDEKVDVTQALKDTENSLRDFIAATLQARYGAQWLAHLGVPEDRPLEWQKRKDAEVTRQEAGVVEERLLYYAQFFDLITILEKNWGDFAGALGDWKTMKVHLSELNKLRDPDAHRRELLPHQKYMALGIAGEIRNRLIRYRSKQETAEDYFPRIESAIDSLGSIWTPEERTRTLFTNKVLRPGDTVDFVITATDPQGGALKYCVVLEDDDIAWQASNTFTKRIGTHHIQRNFQAKLLVLSSRDYHASTQWDDRVSFVYDVLPPK